MGSIWATGSWSVIHTAAPGTSQTSAWHRCMWIRNPRATRALTARVNSVSRFTPRLPKRCAAAARNWRWMPCSLSESMANTRATKRARSYIRATSSSSSASRFSTELLTAALARSDTPLGLAVTDGRTQDLAASGQLRSLVKKPTAYFIEYRDGLKATMLMLDGAIKDFNFAARLKGIPAILSTQ